MVAPRKTASLDLEAPITRLPAVGQRTAARLLKLGIRTVKDLLWHLPSRYEDYSQAVPIDQVTAGQKHSIQGEVVAIGTRFIWPKRMTITTATIRDDSGGIRAVWFNQPYVEDSLSEGTRISLAGKVTLDKRGLQFVSPLYEKLGTSSLRHTGRLIPIYPETEGMTSKYFRYLIQPLLERLTITDPLPASLRRQQGLLDLDSAIRTVHYPDEVGAVEAARKRLAFNDVLLFQLKALQTRRVTTVTRAPAMPMDAVQMRAFIARLPFTLTRDQRVALLEILQDMERAYPMNRLLEGDVGSGKTAVALLAALHTAHHGKQAVLLAPTEVLAQQHAAFLQSLVPKGMHTALMTGAAAMVDGEVVTKTAVRKVLTSGNVGIVIGTHALLEEKITFPHLALVVIDEQHRFGIEQRKALLEKSKLTPHLLSMTATPIPRTLALTIFGDLDISLLRQKPGNRPPVATKVVSSQDRTAMYDAIRQEIKAGRQVFVVCPRIETSSTEVPKGQGAKKLTQSKLVWAEVKAVEDEYKKLSKEVFPDLKVVMLHGRMKPKEKQQIMREFRDGWQDILVATAVIEVGVDVPNATIMLIEGADRFGLAQLHQFRGRVGRSDLQSYCFLVPTEDGASRRRLAVLEKTNDGFALAEQDLKTRGPGEFFGLKQSGLPDLTMAALADVDLIKKARLAARTIMKTDPTLARFPALKKQVELFGTLSHFE